MLELNCPHCQVSNRVPEARLADAPRCGRCHRPLFAGEPMELTRENLQPTLQRNAIPVLVDCWAAWCGPCRQFAPVFAQAAGVLEPAVRLARLDTEALPDAAAHWGVRSIPTLILFRDGRELQRSAGAMSLAQLLRWLQPAGIHPRVGTR